jgi:DNA-binding MarR family transcriptional regulator
VSAVRTSELERVAIELLPRAALLTRLLARQLRGEVTRTEAGVLVTLEDGPRRVTELAELEGLAQPTMTLVVKRLEERGYVSRRRRRDDGRVVMVARTAAGLDALDRFRELAASAMREYLVELSDTDLDALVAANDALEPLIGLLQRS